VSALKFYYVTVVLVCLTLGVTQVSVHSPLA
jgi:hypothetical protein